MGSLFNFIRYNRYIRRAIKAEYLLDKLKYLFGGREFKQDWIGRIFTVVNPNVDNFQTDGNTVVFEEGKPIIEKWLMDNMNLMANFITTNNLFDLLTYKIDRLDEDDNYLIVLQNIFYESAKKELKWFGLGIILIGIIILTILL